jgi:hypothetical protein
MIDRGVSKTLTTHPFYSYRRRRRIAYRQRFVWSVKSLDRREGCRMSFAKQRTTLLLPIRRDLYQMRSMQSGIPTI